MSLYSTSTSKRESEMDINTGPYSAVIFDMDGVLIDSEPLWQEAEIASFADVGVKLTVEDCKSTVGMRIDLVVEHWYERRPWKGASCEEVTHLVIDKVVDKFRTKGRPKEGAIEAIRFFHEKGFPLAIASSSYERIIHAFVETFDLNKYFNVLYSGEYEEHPKPHPGVYLRAADKLGVKAETCLTFEDSAKGVTAARAAGMTCIAVPDDASDWSTVRPLANSTVESLREVPDYFCQVRRE